MSFVCLMAMALIGQEPVIKAHHPGWAKAVEFKVEPIKLGADGVEVVTIRMKIKPNYCVVATPQPDELFKSMQMSLLIKSKDPKTQVDIRYPRPIDVKEFGVHWTKYEGDVVITAFVRRAKGDESSLEGTLRVQGWHTAY